MLNGITEPPQVEVRGIAPLPPPRLGLHADEAVLQPTRLFISSPRPDRDVAACDATYNAWRFATGTRLVRRRSFATIPSGYPARAPVYRAEGGGADSPGQMWLMRRYE